MKWTLRNLEKLQDFITPIADEIERIINDRSIAVLEVKEASRNHLTNAKIHAVMHDIWRQATEQLNGKHVVYSSYSFDVFKAFIVKWFDLELQEMGEPMRKTGEYRIDPRTNDLMYVRPSTTEFTQKEAAKLIEWLYAFGSERGVRFTERASRVLEQYLNIEQSKCRA